MNLAGLDTAAIGRSLAQIADQPGDFADAYFERIEVVELDEGHLVPQFSVRCEEGVALRLMRGGRSWLASRDCIDREAFGGALRQVARAVPQAPYPLPSFDLAESRAPTATESLLSFPIRVTRRLRQEHIAFPLRLAVRSHFRSVRWVGTEVAADPQRERFFSVEAATPWGRCGRLLLELDEAAVEEVVAALLVRFHGRDAPPPKEARYHAVMAPAAAAVLIHEAVAHALECDTLALVGGVERAFGKGAGAGVLSVLDDPKSAPEGVRRDTDDEGMLTVRRWLLREGKVGQPLADLAAAGNSDLLQPGAGRRSNRTQEPLPRSTHLEVVPGLASRTDLLEAAAGGLWISEIDRGRLEPFSGRYWLKVPAARWIESGQVGAPAGALSIRGHVAELAERVTAVGADSAFSGAGWCAKGGVRLPVWATTPVLLLEDIQVGP